MLPPDVMIIDGVFRKLVNPVADWYVIPLIVFELVLVAAWKLIPLTVFVLLEFVPLASVKSSPDTAVAPAAAEASVTVMDCALEASAVKDVFVSARVVPEVAVPVTVSPVNVPTDVREDAVTPEFNVAPDSVPAGAMTTLPEAAVISPLPFTVNVGILVDDPNEPTLEFTVASVVASAPAEVVMSPVSAGNLPAANVPVAFVPERSTALAVITCPAMDR
jgi:hypothetical protein